MWPMLTFETKIPAYLSGKQLALRNQRFLVQNWLLCKGVSSLQRRLANVEVSVNRMKMVERS